jgi:hypothetical protein
MTSSLRGTLSALRERTTARPKRRPRPRASVLAGAGLSGLLTLLTLLWSGGALAQAPPAAAVEKLRAGEVVGVPAGEIVPHDLYVAGGTVRHAGRVEGDLAAAGGQVDVGGAVTGDLLVAGGQVDVRAPWGATCVWPAARPRSPARWRRT